MSKKLRFILLLLLSLTSVFFAEVISGSMKFPLYNLWGWFVVIPLYGLHTIVLLYIITKYTDNKRVLFSTLFFAGVLFGLYEAYLTKVLWVGLNDEPLIFLDISVMDFIVLVFLWHPIMSFIIPSLVFEGFMTNSNNLFQGLPNRFKNLVTKRKLRITLFIFIGAFLSFNSLGPLELILSGFGMGLPILLIYYLLRKKNIHLKYSLDEILPSNKGFIVCVVFLSIMYILMGLFIQRDVLTLSNQLSIWVLYIIFGLLFYFKLRGNNLEEVDEVIKEPIAFKYMILCLLIIVITGVIFVTVNWYLGSQLLFIVLTWIFWMFLGLALLYYSLLH